MITKISTKNMTREEWLEYRRKGIGGSDAGAVLGLNPYRSAFDVYADKLSLIPEKEDNEAMRQGRDLEQYVSERFEEYSGKKVHRVNSILKNSKYPFAFANIDRAVSGEKAGLECKTAKTLSIKRYKNGEFPEEYYCQCMHYIMVTGYRKWYLAVLILGSDFKVFEIERDEDEIKALSEAESRFWNENVKNQIPPPPKGMSSENEAINNMFPNSTSGTVCDLSPFTTKLKRLTDLKNLISECEQEKKQLEQEIKLYMKDCEIGDCDGYKISWKTQLRQSYDTKRLVADFVPEGTSLEDYEKITPLRAFKVYEVQNEEE